MLKTKSRIKKTEGRLCQVSFLISEFDVGPLAADLAAKVSDFQMNWIENVPYHRNKPRQTKSGKGASAKLLKWIAKAGSKGLDNEKGQMLYKRAGFAPSAYYAAVSRLIKMGEVKRIKGVAFLAKGKE